MSLSPEKVETAIRLLHAAGINTADALRSLNEIIGLQQEQIRILTDKVEILEAQRKVDEEKAFQDNQDALDRQDGQWYREVNGLG